jgi:hypothetical protein
MLHLGQIEKEWRALVQQLQQATSSGSSSESGRASGSGSSSGSGSGAGVGVGAPTTAGGAVAGVGATPGQVVSECVQKRRVAWSDMRVLQRGYDGRMAANIESPVPPSSVSSLLPEGRRVQTRRSFWVGNHLRIDLSIVQQQQLSRTPGNATASGSAPQVRYECEIEGLPPESTVFAGPRPELEWRFGSLNHGAFEPGLAPHDFQAIARRFMAMFQQSQTPDKPSATPATKTSLNPATSPLERVTRVEEWHIEDLLYPGGLRNRQAKLVSSVHSSEKSSVPSAPNAVASSNPDQQMVANVWNWIVEILDSFGKSSGSEAVDGPLLVLHLDSSSSAAAGSSSGASTSASAPPVTPPVAAICADVLLVPINREISVSRHN